MIGRSVAENFSLEALKSGTGKAAFLTGLGLAGVLGFNKGLRSSKAEDAFYELATGNPNIDEEILGTNINPANLLLSLPGSRTDIAMHGIPVFRSGIPRLLATTRTGFVNKKTVGAAFSRADTPFATTHNFAPMADGSIVFGLNNARHG